MATKIAVEVDVKTKDAASEIDDLKEQMENLKATTDDLKKKMEGGFKSAEKGAEGASKGMKGFGGSIKNVLKSLGLIAIAAEVFEFIKDLLMSNQKVADALGIAFKTIEVLFNQLFQAVQPLGDALMDAFENPQQALEDLWEAIKTNFLNRIKGIGLAAQAVGKQIEGAFSLDWDMVKEGMQQYGQALVQVGTGLDIEQQNAFVNGIVDAGSAALDTATKIQNLTNEVKLAEAQQQLLILEYQREAEIQRQIRDDVSKTIEERQAANVRLGEILDEQATEELKLSNKRLELRLLEQSVNKDSVDAEIEVINARKEIADINERITGQRSEQLTNENSLKLEGIQISKDRVKQLQEEAEAERNAAFKIAEAKIAADQLLEAYLAERQPMSAEEMLQKEIDDAIKAEEAKRNAAIMAASKTQADLETFDEIEKAFLDESLRIENEIRAKYAAEQIALEEQIAKDKKEIRDKSNEDTIQADIDLQNARVSAAQATAGALGQIASLLEQQGEAGVAAAKAFAVAELAINTAVAISTAIAGATAAAASTPSPATPFLQVAYIATMVGAVVAAVAQATQILNTAPGPSAGTVSASAPSAPSVAPVTTNTTELVNAEAAQLAPVQAFVVESQLSGSQENIQQIQNQATFGLTG
jgi:hypothetical protein